MRYKTSWGFIKSKICEPVGVYPLKDSDGHNVGEREKKTTILNRQFSLVFNNNGDTKTVTDKGQRSYPCMNIIHVTQNGVLKLLSNLNIHKATRTLVFCVVLCKSLFVLFSHLGCRRFQCARHHYCKFCASRSYM
jgi:hypothetical protein